MSDSTSSTIQFVVDASGAKKGAADFESAMARIKAAVKGLDSVKVGFDGLQKTVDKINFTKISQGVAAVNALKIDSSITRDVGRLGAAFASLKGPSTSTINNIVAFGKAMSGLRLSGNTGVKAADIVNMSKAFAGMAIFKAPSSASIKGIAEFGKALSTLPNVTNQVANANAMRNITRALAGMVAFHAPSTSSLQGLHAFATALNTLPTSNGGIAVARTLVQVTQALTQMGNFKPPSQAAIANLLNFAKALQSIQLPPNVYAVVAALNALGDAASKAGSGFSRLKGGSANIGGTFSSISRGAAESSVYTRRLEGDFRGLENAFSATYQMGTLLRGLFGNLTIASFGKEVFEAGNQVQTLKAQLSVTSSPTDAAQQIDFITKTADKLGLSLQTAYEQWGRFVTAGKSAGASTKNIESIYYGVGSAMAVMGIRGIRASNTFLALQEIFDKQKVSAQQMTRQLGQDIPGALAAMEDAAGLHGAAFASAMKKGQIGMDDFVKFGEEMQTKFAPGVQAAVQRASAQLTILENAWTRFKQTVANNGVMDAFADAFHRIGEALNTGTFSGMATQLGQNMASGIRLFGDAATWAANHAQLLVSVLQELAAAAAFKGVAVLGSALHMVFSPVTALIGALSGGLMGALGGVFSGAMLATRAFGMLGTAATLAGRGVLATATFSVNAAYAFSRLVLGGQALVGLMASLPRLATAAATAFATLDGALSALMALMDGAKVQGFLTALGGGIATIMSGGITVLLGGMLAAAGAIYMFRDRMVSVQGQTVTLGSVAMGVWDSVKGYASSAADEMRSVMDEFFTWISPKWGEMAGAGGSAFDQVARVGVGLFATIQKSYDKLIASPVGAWMLKENANDVSDAKNLWNGNIKDFLFTPNSVGQGADDKIAAARKRLAADNYMSEDMAGYTGYMQNTVLPDAKKRDIANGILPDDIRAEAIKDSATQGLDPARMIALLQQEGGGYNNVSKSGAFGPGQLMPGTAAEYGVTKDSPWQANLNAAMEYFAKLLKQFGGNYDVAEAAYNAGPNNTGVKAFAQFGGARNYRGLLPTETQGYLSGIDGRGGFTSADSDPSDQHGPEWGKVQVDQDKLNAAVSKYDKVDAAKTEMADYKALLDNAVKAKASVNGLVITQQVENSLLAQQAQELNDQINPGQAVLRNIQERTAAHGASARATTQAIEVEKQYQETMKNLTRVGDTSDVNSSAFQAQLRSSLNAQYTAEHPRSAIVQDPYGSAMNKLAQQTSDANLDDSRQAKIESQYDALVRSIQKADPTVKLGTEQLNNLHAAVEKLYEAQHPTGLDAIEKSIKPMGEAFDDVTKHMMTSFEDVFVKMAETGKVNWTGMLQSIRGEIAKFLIDQTIKKFLSMLGFGGTDSKTPGIGGSSGAGSGGSSGGWGMLGGAMNSAQGYLFGGGKSNGGSGAGGGSGFLGNAFNSASNWLFGGSGSTPAATPGAAAVASGNPDGGVGLGTSSAVSTANLAAPASSAQAVIANATGAAPIEQDLFSNLGLLSPMAATPAAADAASPSATPAAANDNSGLTASSVSEKTAAAGGGGGSGGNGGLIDTAANLGKSFASTAENQAVSAVVKAGMSYAASAITAAFAREGGYSDSPMVTTNVSSTVFAGAPAYAEGTANTSDGIPAILHPNEAVVPLSRGRTIPVELSGENQASSESGAVTHNHTWNINTPNADSFRRSMGQVQASMATTMSKAQSRNN